MVSARLIGQFGLILWGETSDCTHFFLVRSTEKIKTVLDQKVFQKIIGALNVDEVYLDI